MNFASSCVPKIYKSFQAMYFINYLELDNIIRTYYLDMFLCAPSFVSLSHLCVCHQCHVWREAWLWRYLFACDDFFALRRLVGYNKRRIKIVKIVLYLGNKKNRLDRRPQGVPASRVRNFCRKARRSRRSENGFQFAFEVVRAVV